MKKHEFYLEISDRQTGKSTRLVQAVKDYINETGGNAIIHAPSVERVQLIARFFSKSELAHVYLATYQDAVRGVYGKNFFDEFDFNETVFYDPHGYYVTTPAHVRNKNDLKYFDKKFLEESFILNLVAAMNTGDWNRAFIMFKDAYNIINDFFLKLLVNNNYQYTEYINGVRHVQSALPKRGVQIFS